MKRRTQPTTQRKPAVSLAKRLFGRRVLARLLIYFCLIVGGLMIFENHLIFVPSKYPTGDWNPAAIRAEDAWFQSADGTKLHGWYTAHPDAQAVVLFCHGNAGNVAHRGWLISTLRDEARASVLLFDYRGYGRSEGKPNEPGVLADARAARAWLATKEGIAESDVVLMGRSLGGAVAVDLAAKDGARGLVLESTFTSVPDVAARRLPFLPCRTMIRTRLDSLSKIADYHGPLLQSHGDADTTVPYDLGRRLFDTANEPKQFVTIPNTDHNDPQPASYYATLRQFLASLPE